MNQPIIILAIIVIFLVIPGGIVIHLMANNTPEPTEDQDFLPIKYNNTKPAPITNCVDADGNEIQESYQTKCHPLFQP